MIILVGQTQAVLGENYSSRDDVREFIKSLVIENFSESELLKIFREAEKRRSASVGSAPLGYASSHR